MELHRDSFLFKVGYGLSEKETEIKQTNLCKFFWRFVLMLLIGWPFAICVVSLFTAFIFLFARKLDRSDGELIIISKKWPSIFGFNIWPIWPMFLGLFLLGIFLDIFPPSVRGLTISIFEGIAYVLSFVPWFMAWIFAYILAILIILSIVYLFISTLKDLLRMPRVKEIFWLFREWRKAKKDKVCPLIEIVG